MASKPNYEELYRKAQEKYDALAKEKDALAKEKDALNIENALVETVNAVATAFQTVLKDLRASPNCPASVSVSREADDAAELAYHGVPTSGADEEANENDNDDDEAESIDGGIEDLTEANKLEIASQRRPAEGGHGTNFKDFVGTWVLPTSMDDRKQQHVAELASAINAYMSNPMVSTVYAKLKDHRQKEQKRTTNEKKKKKLEVGTVKVSERKDTQPFVNGIMMIAMSTYKKLQIDKSSNLFLFAEVAPLLVDQGQCYVAQRNDLSRIPDAAVFSQGVKSLNVKFGPAAQSKTTNLTVEAKRCTDNTHLQDALVECERDFGQLNEETPRREMPVGYSIVTDGVDWYFLQMCWSFGKDQNEWKRRIQISQKISADNDVTPLASWLVYMFLCTLEKKVNDTGLNIQVRVKDASADVDILSHSTRSFTAKISHKEGHYVFKRWHRSEGRLQKSKIYLEKEIRYLETLQGCASICRKVKHFWLSTTSVCLEYGGSPLRSLDISGEKGRRLAQVVKKGILDGALHFLADHKISHNDIHEANIVVDGQTARLIDFESCSGLRTDDCANSPTVVGPAVVFEEAGVVQYIDEICTVGVLSCLWEQATAQFPRNQAARTNILRKFIKRDERTELINRIANETDQ